MWKTTATKTAAVSPDQMQQLASEFERINFLSLGDDYDKQGPGCPSRSTR